MGAVSYTHLDVYKRQAINKTYGMEDAGMLALTDTVQFLNKVTEMCIRDSS